MVVTSQAQFNRRSGNERRRGERRLISVSKAVLEARKERRERERRSGKERRGTPTTKTKQEIINDLDAHIKDGGGGYPAWYVGIASDARDRLFNDHKVKEKGDSWVFRQTSFSGVAREIEDYFVNMLGTDGGAGKGVVFTDMVYAYKKASHTDP